MSSASERKARTGGKDDPNASRYARNNAGRVIFFSPSSAAAFAGCNRYWWYTAVMGQKEPENPTLAFGTAVHLVLETWLQKGEVLPEGIYKGDRNEDVVVTADHIARATSSLKLLPPPGVGNVEHWALQTPVYDGPDGLILFAGKLDWHNRYGAWQIPGLEVPRNFQGMHILDHKTKSSDGGRYGIPTAEDLARDPQGLKYSHVVTAGTEFEGTDVIFSHNYVLKDANPRARRVDTIMRASDIKRHWEAQAAPARNMILLSKADRAEDVPANTGYCYRYGKDCPLVQICPAHKARSVNFFDAMAAFDGGDDTKDAGTTPRATETPMGFWDMMEEKAAPPTEGKAPSKASAAEVTEPPSKPLGVQPDDAHPHDDDHVQEAFVRDVVQVARAAQQQQIDAGKTPLWSLVTVAGMCEREGIGRAWAANIAFLAGLKVVEADHVAKLAEFSIDEVLKVPAEALLSVGAGGDADRAAALARAPLTAFPDLAGRSPRAVLLLARPQCSPQKQAIIDGLLDEGRLQTPFDAETDVALRNALRALYVRKFGGETLDEDMVDGILKEHGVYKRKSGAKITEVLDRLNNTPDEATGGIATAATAGVSSGAVLATTDVLGTKTLTDLVNHLVSLAKDDGAKVRAHIAGLLAVHDAKMAPSTDATRAPAADEEAFRKMAVELQRSRERLVVLESKRPSEGDLTIYAGTRPLSTEGLQHIEKLLEPVDAAATKRVRLLDGHASAEHWSLADFGRGPVIFREELKKWLTNHGLPTGAWFFPRNSQYQNIPLVEIFEAAGATVVLPFGG